MREKLEKIIKLLEFSISNLDSLSVLLRKIDLSVDFRKCTRYFILSTDGACVVAVSILGK